MNGTPEVDAGHEAAGIDPAAAANPAYTPYHPKWHRRRIPIFWWLGKRAYATFVARELTSVFVGYSALVLLLLAWSIARGPESYARALELLARPGVVAFHGFVLLALIFHSVTWLNLTPQALSPRVAGRRVPGGAILAAHYFAWLAVSAGLVWILLWRM